MLTTLTTYLLKHKQVTIPYIGSFELKPYAAKLDFASRLILPPGNEVVYSSSEEVDEHQLTFLSEAANTTKDVVVNQLQVLGQQLKESLGHNAFEWKGIGRLEQRETEIVFYPILQNRLEPVAAHKVTRENVAHAVTIGDKEMQSDEASEMLQTAPEKSYLLLVVWILILLALFFIGYWFYSKGFTPLSSGSQQRVAFVKRVLPPLC